MLTLLLEPSGSGALEELTRRICADTAAGRSALLLVPEQYSHEMERTLCARGGNSVSLHAEVLSFTRLAARVEGEAGGAARPVLDEGGRLLTMYRAQQMVAHELTLFAAGRKTDSLRQMLRTIDELKLYQVTPEQLLEAAEAAEGLQSRRFRELFLLYGAYDGLLAQGPMDPADRLTRLGEALDNCAYGAGKALYIHGFTDYTAQERGVVERLLARAKSVTMTLPCDSLDPSEDGDLFAFARRTGRQMQDMARRHGISCEAVQLSSKSGGKPPALRHLETALLEDFPRPLEGSGEGLELFSAGTAFSEVEYAAARILRLQKETGCRFRDIRVAAAGFEGYGALVDTVFSRYGIPVFLSRMTNILEKPILSLVTSALEAISGGYELDDMLRYMKTGLTGLSMDAVDRLEDYAARWNIRGRGWTGETDWTMHPGGFGAPWTEADEALLAELNIGRRSAVAPLVRLEKAKGKTARTQAAALYGFLEDIGLPQRLEERSDVLLELGQRELAEEYHQLWEILCGALDQCAQLLEDGPMERMEFAALFTMTLSQYDVGTIPVSLDRVTAGEASRMAQTGATYVFLLGATDGAIPAISAGQGLLLDEDRVFLEGCGCNMAPTGPERLFREMETIYQVLTMGDKGLFVSWPQRGTGGEALLPSSVVERLRALVPQAPVHNEAEQRGRYRLSAPLPALDALALYRNGGAHLALLAEDPRYGETVRRMKRAGALRRGSLSPQTVQALYGSSVSMSASRMDKYQSCHFAYFMQYGLKARVRRKAKLDAPQMGNFIHFVLEHVLTEAAKHGGVAEVSDAFLKKETDAGADRYAQEEMGGLLDKSRRLKYLFSRLKKNAYPIVENVAQELRASDFQPLSFELGFGKHGEGKPVELQVGDITLSVTGFVDRVDGWEKDGTLYLRVVDYKTGAKDFDLTEIWNGMGMQTLLYLFALEKEGELLYKTPTAAAAALYLPARQVVLQGEHGMTEEERRKKTDSLLKRRGLLLSSPEVLEAMEHFEETGGRFLPVRLSKKTGAISGDALISAVQFETLSRHLDRLLHQIAQELGEGRVDASPWYRGPQSHACVFCDFAPACQFDPSRGDKRRFLPTVSQGEFWKRLEETGGELVSQEEELPF